MVTVNYIKTSRHYIVHPQKINLTEILKACPLQPSSFKLASLKWVMSTSKLIFHLSSSIKPASLIQINRSIISHCSYYLLLLIHGFHLLNSFQAQNSDIHSWLSSLSIHLLCWFPDQFCGYGQYQLVPNHLLYFMFNNYNKRLFKIA